MSLTQTPQLSMSCAVRPTWPCTTKMTAQANGRSMASLVELERYLWLNLTEMEDVDKVPFLDYPVSPIGLFGPAVEGFSKCFIAKQKSSQAMRHFLPKRPSSAAASIHPEMGPTQQPAKAAPPAVQPASRPATHAWPDRKRKGLSPAAAGPPLKKHPLYLLAFSSGCGQQSVCEKYCCEHWVLSHSAHTANHCYKEKNKTNIFKKRALFLFPLSRASVPR